MLLRVGFELCCRFGFRLDGQAYRLGLARILTSRQCGAHDRVYDRHTPGGIPLALGTPRRARLSFRPGMSGVLMFRVHRRVKSASSLDNDGSGLHLIDGDLVGVVRFKALSILLNSRSRFASKIPRSMRGFRALPLAALMCFMDVFIARLSYSGDRK